MMKIKLFILFLTCLFVGRFFVFIATQNAGIEHDSGWYLGVARNIAERGIYASYTNTVADSEKVGAFPSIHGRFSVQDAEGYSYFPAGVTVSPGFIVPQAVIYRLFGFGIWQNRVIAFAAFCILIPLLFSLLYMIGGLIPIIVFALWIWFFPQIFLSFSYEAYSEHLALLYLLLGLSQLYRFSCLDGRQVEKSSSPSLFWGGIFLSLSFLTKSLYLIGIVPIMLSFVYFFYRKTADEKKTFKAFFFLCVAILLPILLFESYRVLFLLTHFGWNGVIANNRDNYMTMKCCGSGVLQFIQHPFPLSFMYRKLMLWFHVGIHPLLMYGLLASTAVTMAQKQRSFIEVSLWGIFFSFFGWYVFLSSTGFFRHAWPAAVIGMLLASLILSRTAFVRIMMSVALFAAIISSPYKIPQLFITRQAVMNIYKAPSPNQLQGPLFVPLFSLSDQLTASSYINLHNSKIRRLCYDSTLLVAELPIFVDRVFYPLKRCNQTNDVLVIGPYQKNLSIMGGNYLSEIKKNTCKKTLFENISYTMCSL